MPQSWQILSRRNSKSKVDFKPDDPSGDSPFAQLRRLQRVLTAGVIPEDDFQNMDEAIDSWREFTYRKVFSGTTHEEFVALDSTEPERIDWLLAVASVDNEVWQSKRKGN